jgi:hypothetical protein
MPRVRLTAGSWLLAAALLAIVPAPRAQAAPPVAGRRTGPGAAPAAGVRPSDSEARRREEIDAVQRQDAAEALKQHFNIDVDWRATPLDQLIDIRVRAAKAADLQARLGVSVDWQRYSWIELEALRRTLLSFESYRNADIPADTAPVTAQSPSPPPSPSRWPSASVSANALVRPTFKVRAGGRAGRSTDPDAIIRPRFTGRTEAPVATGDPDGVIRPTFAVRPRWASAEADPDGLITPTFLPVVRFAPIGDADDLMDPTRAQDAD